MDIHSPQIAGFYPSSQIFVSLDPKLVFGYHITMRNHGDGVVIVSPDVGYVKSCEKLSEELGVPMAAIYKRRVGKDRAVAKAVMGDIEGKNCIILDDETSTGCSLIGAKTLLEEKGAKSVRAYVTHNKLSDEESYQRVADSGLELICTDTVQAPVDCAKFSVGVISVAPMFGEAIERMHTGRTTEDLFRYRHIVSLYDRIKAAGDNISFLYA